MDLVQKSLPEKGNSTDLALTKIHAKMLWKTAIDMDLHVYYQLKPGKAPEKTGFLNKIFGGGVEKSDGHIYFANRGNKEKYPWIYLDGDAGVGNQEGDNEENIYFTELEKLQHLLIVVNIFNEPNACFADFDAKVILITDTESIEIPLTETAKGSYCTIAHIDNSGDNPRLININKSETAEPDISSYF